MDESASAICAEIAATRERMTRTVEALRYRADVRARASEAVAARVATARTARDRALRAATTWPGAAIGAATLAFLLGVVLPARRTRSG